MNRGAERHATEGAEGKKVGKSVVERCIMTPMPNHLSTYYFLSFSPHPRGGDERGK